MNQNTPNPGVALRWPHPCSLPIEWGSRGCPPNANLRPRVVLDTQVWLPARDGDGMCCHPSNGIMINSRGERRTKALEGTEDYPTDSEQHQAEKPEGTDTVTTNHHMRLVEFSHVALEDPLATGVGLWIKLILFIKHCNCNCNLRFLLYIIFFFFVHFNILYSSALFFLLSIMFNIVIIYFHLIWNNGTESFI